MASKSKKRSEMASGGVAPVVRLATPDQILAAAWAAELRNGVVELAVEVSVGIIAARGRRRLRDVARPVVLDVTCPPSTSTPGPAQAEDRCTLASSGSRGKAGRPRSESASGTAKRRERLARGRGSSLDQGNDALAAGSAAFNRPSGASRPRRPGKIITLGNFADQGFDRLPHGTPIRMLRICSFWLPDGTIQRVVPAPAATVEAIDAYWRDPTAEAFLALLERMLGLPVGHLSETPLDAGIRSLIARVQRANASRTSEIQGIEDAGAPE